MENSFIKAISSSRSVLILMPTNPHFDQVASGLSLYLSLKSTPELASAMSIACPSQMLVEVNRLVGVDKIVTELGNKNLAIAFAGYPVEHLQTVSYDIVNGEIQIKVEPKPGFAAPSKEQVALSYSGTSAETIILVGGAHIGHFPSLTQEGLDKAKLIHIGIRSLSLNPGMSVYSLARASSAVSEVIFGIIKENNLALNEDIATNILMGIEESTKGFTSPEVNADTFAAVSELMKKGGKRFTRLDRPDRRQYPAGAIPSQPFVSRPAVPRPPQTAPQTPIKNEPKVDKSIETPPEPVEVPKEWLNEPKIFKGSDTPLS